MLKSVTGIVVLVAAGAAFAPAALLDAPFEAVTQRRLRLADTTGWWWRGHGAVASADGSVRIPVSWNVEGAALARGSFVVRIGDANDGALRATITVGTTRIDARDVHARLPAMLLATLDPSLQTLTPGGSIVVDAPLLSKTGGAVTGMLDAKWMNARLVTEAAIVDVGTVALTANLGMQPATATIGNTGGDVAVAGTIVDRAGILDADVVLRPAASASVETRNALAMLGAPDATGAVRVVWHARR